MLLNISLHIHSSSLQLTFQRSCLASPLQEVLSKCCQHLHSHMPLLWNISKTRQDSGVCVCVCENSLADWQKFTGKCQYSTMLWYTEKSYEYLEVYSKFICVATCYMQYPQNTFLLIFNIKLDTVNRKKNATKWLIKKKRKKVGNQQWYKNLWEKKLWYLWWTSCHSCWFPSASHLMLSLMTHWGELSRVCAVSPYNL